MNRKLRFASCAIDLFDVFPARRGEGCRKIGDAEFLRFQRRGFQAQKKTAFAPPTALGFALQSANATQPFVVVVVAVDPAHTEAFGMTLALLFANFVFLARENVRIVIENDGTHTIRQHPFDNGRRTWGTTGVQ